ncbi:MAG: hypothetical protein J6R18_00230, partial [Kiritimatiellae bacterium]|nr:hypothetical protein [Kiritimatiellia bacterium]
VALMTHEQRQAEKQAKALALAIEETKASYNSALSAAQGFSSGLSSLESAIKAVNSLTEGTREWKLALLEANEQAFSLLETYPELAGYMQKTNGYITFTEEGIDSISNKLYARTQTVQNMYFEAQQKQLQFEFDQLSKQVAKSAVNFSKLQLSTEEIEKTFDFAQNYQPLQPGDSGQAAT